MKPMLLLLIVGFGEFTTFLSLFILSSFYPKYAEERGLSGVSTGTITGIPMAPVLFAVYGSVILGRYTSPKRQAVCGLLITAISSTFFGVLEWATLDNATYTALAILLRVVQGCGMAITDVSLFILAAEIATKGRESVTVGAVEFSVDIGLAIAPLIGGALFQLGGFVTPFFVMGMWSVLVAVLCQVCLPNTINQNQYSALEIIKHSFEPNLLLCVCFFLQTHISVGFLTGMIEPHLRQYDLSPSAIGAVVLASEAVSASTFPFWGYLCEKWMRPFTMCVIGCILGAAGFVIFGPFPLLNFELKLWMIIISLILVGLSSSAVLISVYIQANYFARYLGCDDGTRHAVISALYTGTSGLGLFLGAFVGGFFIDYLGYRNGSALLFSGQILSIFTQVLLSYRLDAKSQINENSILLPDESRRRKSFSSISDLSPELFKSDNGS